MARYLLALTSLTLALLGLLAAGGLVTAAEPAAPRAEDIARWIKELNSDKYVVRELATEGLIEAGRAAIGPLSEAIPGGNQEVVSRAANILKTLAIVGEGDVADEALAALEKAAAGKTPAARRAASALATLDTQRQTRAMAELRRHGAKFLEAPVQIAQNISQQVPTIEIGDAWTGGERGLTNLRWANEVSQVIFTGEKVQDDWLKSLKSLPTTINYLKFKRTKITDAGLRHLAAMPDLKQLNILYTPLTDKAVDELKALKNLTDIRLYGTSMTEEGAAKLAAAAPGLTVDFRRGAFVGVGCDAMTPQCFVTYIIPKSAADQAGVEPGDVIIGYGGDPVTNFESFKSLIQKHAAGQKVEIELLREDEKVKKTLVLGEWE